MDCPYSSLHFFLSEEAETWDKNNMQQQLNCYCVKPGTEICVQWVEASAAPPARGPEHIPAHPPNCSQCWGKSLTYSLSSWVIHFKDLELPRAISRLAIHPHFTPSLQTTFCAVGTLSWVSPSGVLFWLPDTSFSQKWEVPYFAVYHMLPCIMLIHNFGPNLQGE